MNKKPKQQRLQVKMEELNNIASLRIQTITQTDQIEYTLRFYFMLKVSRGLLDNSLLKWRTYPN